jgi:DNA-binding IclR family transcriptional regulator
MTDGAQSIYRAVKLLKAFNDDHPIWELGALAASLDLNKTTAFRMLTALEKEGLVERDDGGRYHLGAEMIALGGRAARVNNLRHVAHTHLTRLSQATGETVTLEIPRPGDENGSWMMLVIDEVLGRHLVGITQYIGTRLPIHATSTGKVVLAFTPHEQVSGMLTFPLPDYTGQTRLTQADLQADLAAVRDCYYSIVTGELEEGLVAIGAPIFDHNGSVKAAVSLVGPSVRITPQQAVPLAERVHQTAVDISYAIGHRP